MFDDFANDAADDSHVGEEKIVAAHAGTAGYAGGDDNEVGAGGLFVAVGAGDQGVGADDGAGLEHVEGLALGKVFDDVDEDDVGVAEFVDALGGGGADVAGAYDGYFLSHVQAFLLCFSG